MCIRDRCVWGLVPQNDEIWLCYPTLNATLGRADEALVWNYRSNVWSKRDLLNVTAGNVGPIPGGGLQKLCMSSQALEQLTLLLLAHLM